MNTAYLRRTLVIAALGLTANTPGWAAKVSMESATAGSVTGLLPQAMAPIWSKAGVDVELAMGQTLTKSLLKLGQGGLDTSVIPPSAYADLIAGKGPYAQMGDKGKPIAEKTRALFGFTASSYHVLVTVDSGISDWSKIKGKRVYIGPPAGAANAQITALVKRGSGYEAGKDYEGIKTPWGVATQSFQDGQFDVHVLTGGTGSAVVTELSLARKIRLLPLPPDAMPPADLGMAMGVIPKGTYKGVNDDADVPVWKTVMMFMAKKDLSDDVAYKLTKSYIESRKELAKGNALLRDLPGDDPFIGVTAPLHPGAARYYKEAGIKIPAELMPR